MNEFISLKIGDVVAKYNKEFCEVLEVFGVHGLTVQAENVLKEVAELIISRKEFSPLSSGIVIAGFGDKEICPSLYSFQTDGKIYDRLIVNDHVKYDVGRDRSAAICPFVQREMVAAFMEGLTHVTITFLLMHY